MKLLKLIPILLYIVTIISCKKSEKLDTDIPGLGGDNWVQTDLDKWLYDSLTHPYNIQVKYKWDQFELELNKTLVPPLESQVRPVLDAMLQIWINTYKAEAGDVFFKKYSPKLIVAVGSPSFNPDGSVTLGTAEGGRRVVLYDLNDYDNTNVDAVKQMVHVVEHEYGHILNQNVLYPQEFKLISAGKYTANWINQTDEQARAEGFISAYAKASPDEDFVEMISIMLTEGRLWFEMLVNSENTEAATALRSKEQMVVSYYKDVWNIDFYSLQTRVQQALDDVTGRVTFSSQFGYAKTYSAISFNKAALAGASPSFLAIYNSISSELDDNDITLDSMKVKFTTPSRVAVQLFFKFQQQSGYTATFTYNVSTGAGGVLKFTYSTADNNGSIIKDIVQPLLDYFSNYQFTPQLGTNRSPGSTDIIGALVPVEQPTIYYVGVAGN